MKQRGFTLIELMIGIVILAIIGLMAVGSTGDRNSKLSIGINGLTESRCIEGYKFVVGEHGQARQILDEFGKGVRCEQTGFKP
jgi:prepilin-type N-terminal cleavage/methylation domain-containing protein